MIFLALFLIPGSPAFLSKERWIIFILWVSMGVVFYSLQAKEYRKIPEKKLTHLILAKNYNEG